jgi:hypothetical protein
MTNGWRIGARRHRFRDGVALARDAGGSDKARRAATIASPENAAVSSADPFQQLARAGRGKSKPNILLRNGEVRDILFSDGRMKLAFGNPAGKATEEREPACDI